MKKILTPDLKDLKIMTDHPHRGVTVSTRQQVLVLYLSSTSLEGNVAGWAFYNGLEKDLYFDDDTPPYETGLAALKDGWRMINYPTLQDIDPRGGEHDLGYLKNEFVFEKIIPEGVA